MWLAIMIVLLPNGAAVPMQDPMGPQLTKVQCEHRLEIGKAAAAMRGGKVIAATCEKKSDPESMQ